MLLIGWLAGLSVCSHKINTSTFLKGLNQNLSPFEDISALLCRYWSFCDGMMITCEGSKAPVHLELNRSKVKDTGFRYCKFVSAPYIKNALTYGPKWLFGRKR